MDRVAYTGAHKNTFGLSAPRGLGDGAVPTQNSLTGAYVNSTVSPQGREAVSLLFLCARSSLLHPPRSTDNLDPSSMAQQRILRDFDGVNAPTFTLKTPSFGMIQKDIIFLIRSKD